MSQTSSATGPRFDAAGRHGARNSHLQMLPGLVGDRLGESEDVIRDPDAGAIGQRDGHDDALSH